MVEKVRNTQFGSDITMISALEMFKVGIGPSSSHTLGPMKAGKDFALRLQEQNLLPQVVRVVANLYGSLSLTGKGHQTDQAIVLGLMGEEPGTVDIDTIPVRMQALATSHTLALANGTASVPFSLEGDILFHETVLPLHENGMQLQAFSANGLLFQEEYYSVGGGVVVRREDFGKPVPQTHTFPYPFASAEDLLHHCQETGLSLASLIMKNECSLRSKQEVTHYCTHIWEVMQQCIERGMQTEGLLPGPMRVGRRAPNLRRLLASRTDVRQDPLLAMDWVNLFALAVSEENAAGGRVVTAPTNGACGIIPAVLAYYNKFVCPLGEEERTRFLLTAGAIGLLFRMNASISGAEVGCQGEVGVACSMAAAGLAELMGASPQQTCVAAEIGMEHNLGLTCDPVGGQVQIPCIERNAINAVKAINAARMALKRSSTPSVSLDKVIEAMFVTGKDMNAKYRETAQGGLANVGLVGCS